MSSAKALRTARSALNRLLTGSGVSAEALVGGAKAQVETPLNGLGHIKWLLNQGRDCTIFNWADSLSNSPLNPREIPFRLMDIIAADYPTGRFEVQTWNPANQSFDNVTVVQAGSGGPKLTVRNFSVPGSKFQYGQGKLWTKSGLAIYPADMLLTVHGLNQAGARTLPMSMGEILCPTEQYRLAHPGTPIVSIIENPPLLGTDMAVVAEAYKRISALRDITIMDAYTPYMAAGRPQAWYQDLSENPVLHPSDAGLEAVYVPLMRDLWQKSPPRPFVAATSTLAPTLPSDQNLLTDLRKWDGTGVPPGWTAIGTITATKDTAVVGNPALGYSLKLAGSGASATYLRYDAPNDLWLALRGVPITLTARIRRPEGGPGSLGRMALLSNGLTVETASDNNQQGDAWVYWSIANFVVPEGATFLQVRVYHDNSATPSATYAVNFDPQSLTLVVGQIPRSVA